MMTDKEKLAEIRDFIIETTFKLKELEKLEDGESKALNFMLINKDWQDKGIYMRKNINLETWFPNEDSTTFTLAFSVGESDV